MQHIAITLLIAATLGAWVATAAQDAQPGTTWYWFRTHVNDRVQADLIQLRTPTESSAQR